MKLSKKEQVLRVYKYDDVDCYAVTRNASGQYTLYRIIDGDYQKMKTSESAANFTQLVEKDRGE